MDEKLNRLETILEPKLEVLIDAIERADATTIKYKELLGNLDTTLAFLTNLKMRNYNPNADVIGEFAVEAREEGGE